MTCTALYITLQGFSHGCHPVRAAEAFLILLRKSDPPPKRVMNLSFFPVPQTVEVIDQVRSDWILLPILSHLSGFFFVFSKVTSFSQCFLKNLIFFASQFLILKVITVCGSRDETFFQTATVTFRHNHEKVSTIETCVLHNTLYVIQTSIDKSEYDIAS